MNADPRQPSRLPYAAPSITEPIVLADLWCGAVEGLTDRMLFSAYIHEDHPPHVHVRLIDFSNDQQHYEWDVCNTNGDELTERVVWEFVHEAMVHAEPLRPATLAPSPALRARLAAAGLGPAAN